MKAKARWSLEKRQCKTLMDNYSALLERHPDSELFQRKYEEYKQKFEDAE